MKHAYGIRLTNQSVSKNIELLFVLIKKGGKRIECVVLNNSCH